MIEYAEGKTLEQLMNENPDKLEEYMEKFVDLQLSMHEKKSSASYAPEGQICPQD